MDWENERYVRIYTRKTVPYILAPWQYRAIRDLIYKELDRAGLMDLGGYDPVDAVAAAILMPREVVEVGLEKLLEDETYVLRNGYLISENYIDAQEANQSDKARSKASREKRKAIALKQSVTKCDGDDTGSDGSDTNSDETVTPCRAVLNRAVPSACERANAPPALSPPWLLLTRDWHDIAGEVTGREAVIDPESNRKHMEKLDRLTAGDRGRARRAMRACWEAKHAKGKRAQPKYLVEDFDTYDQQPAVINEDPLPPTDVENWLAEREAKKTAEVSS